MKNIFIVVLLIASVAFGALYIAERNRHSQSAAELTTTQGKLNEAEQQLRDHAETIDQAKLARQKAQVLQTTLEEASTIVAENSRKVTELEAGLAAAKTNKGDNMFARLLDDPEMKNMIKSAQQDAFKGMIDRQYDALIKQLNLNPEQATALKALLNKKMMAGAEMGMSLMAAQGDEQRKAQSEQLRAQNAETDAEIRALLGDDAYASFQKYEKTTPDRTVVSQFSSQLSKGDTAMTSDQEQQLIQAMSQARSNYKWTTDFNSIKPGEPGYGEMFTDQRVQAYEQESIEFDRQFLAEAGKILSAEQLTSFESFQAKQRKNTMMGMKMAVKMFGTKQ